jgi:hypothetical protein
MGGAVYEAGHRFDGSGIREVWRNDLRPGRPGELRVHRNFHSIAEKLALAALLTRTIEDERDPLSPRAFAG